PGCLKTPPAAPALAKRYRRNIRMARPSRGAGVVGLLTLFLCGLAHAQGVGGDVGARRGPEDSSPVTAIAPLPTDSSLTRRLEAARDYARGESSVEATRLLQRLL